MLDCSPYRVRTVVSRSNASSSGATVISAMASVAAVIWPTLRARDPSAELAGPDIPVDLE